MKTLITVFLLAFTPIYAAPKPANTFPTEILQVFSAPKSIILYSIEPKERSQQAGNYFYTYKILGKVELKSSQGKLVVNSIKNAAKKYTGDSPLCFEPRHGLRIVSNDHIYDFVICYTCDAIDVYKDDKIVVSMGITDSPKLLNDLLTANSVPLANPEP